MKHSLFLVTIFLITGCTSVKDTSLVPRYWTIRKSMKGPVKSKWLLDSISLGDANNRDQFLVEEHNGESLGVPDVIGFYQPDGRLERSYQAATDSIINIDDGFRGGGYFYFNNDLEKKSKFLQNPAPRNVYNPYEIELHKIRCSKIISRQDTIIKSGCKVSNFFKEYDFDKEGRVVEERKYWGKYNEDYETYQYKDLRYTVTWLYNNEGQITQKNYKLEPEKISYTIDHNLEVSSKRHTPVETYTYDDQGRLTSLKTYQYKERVENGGFAAFWENYFYEGDRLVRKTTRFVKGAQAFLEGVKALRELYYNEQGDVIKIEAKNIDGSIYQTYYYEYEYDHYNNWVKCRKYINQKTKIPHNVLTRVITYYEEDEKKK